MPKGDVVLSEAEHEALKALLRAHKAVADAEPTDPLYLIRLPEVCRLLVFAATGSAGSVGGPGGVVIEEGALTNVMLERLEKV